MYYLIPTLLTNHRPLQKECNCTIWKSQMYTDYVFNWLFA